MQVFIKDAVELISLVASESELQQCINNTKPHGWEFVVTVTNIY